MSRMILIAVAALLFAAGCSSPPKPRAGVVASSQGADGSASGFPMPDSTDADGAYRGTTDYRLGPQDLIEIEVFQAEELNRTVRVNTRGQISLPLVGVIDVGGLTVPEVEKSLSDRLADGLLQDPHVSVFVKEYTSQRVTVEGSVNRPGIYPLQGRTSLLQALAIAGGASVVADENAIVVFRVIDGVKMAGLFDIEQIRAGTADDPDIYGDDIVVVLRSGGRTFLRSIGLSIGGLGFRPL